MSSFSTDEELFWKQSNSFDKNNSHPWHSTISYFKHTPSDLTSELRELDTSNVMTRGLDNGAGDINIFVCSG